eukprot:2426447-Alexandrium_andersonii.AAC.1
MAPPQAKAPPSHIFPGLNQQDAMPLSRVRAAAGGAAYRVVSPPSAPTSGSTVSSGDRHGGVPAGPAPLPTAPPSTASTGPP